jgi:hypothetical protein
MWLTPQQALKANIAGDIPLTPPALCILEELESFSLVEDIIGFARDSSISDPILPVLTTINGNETLLFPGDDLYAAYGGKAKQNDSNPTQTVRLILEKGRWIPSLPSHSDS